MLKSIKVFLTLLVLTLSLSLSACVSLSPVSGLKSYIVPEKGYEFLYPNGWIPVELSEGNNKVDVVFRDLIQRSENLSVIVSETPSGTTLKELGTPSEVGYRFLKEINQTPESDRTIDLIRADARESKGKTYYILEYEVALPNQTPRHDLASIAISRGKLFTFNLSTSQKRWDKVKEQFNVVVNSFSVR